ncbi:MAG: hypothetical protein ACRD18_03200, partial [Terriglobia bacterium]
FHPQDVEYVVGRTGLRLEEIKLDDYPKETLSRHRAFILDFYHYKVKFDSGVSGHGFSRAKPGSKRSTALAAEGISG